MSADFTNATWQRSKACTDGTSCVEVAKSGNRIGIRDSKQGGDPALVVSEREWHEFVAGIVSGDFQ
ncbi:DUF397 domain-containing protein [Nonomuraea sp. NPDC005650]|uniref:DUF397 domain-containing protein n=1 Tax=Nonomuraea sp. NPDC005650 TaxID=3157045 RepID=UPI0033BED34D